MRQSGEGKKMKAAIDGGLDQERMRLGSDDKRLDVFVLRYR
jgi:hypothetical protein